MTRPCPVVAREGSDGAALPTLEVVLDEDEEEEHQP